MPLSATVIDSLSAMMLTLTDSPEYFTALSIRLDRILPRCNGSAWIERLSAISISILTGLSAFSSIIPATSSTIGLTATCSMSSLMVLNRSMLIERMFSIIPDRKLSRCIMIFRNCRFLASSLWS